MRLALEIIAASAMLLLLLPLAWYTLRRRLYIRWLEQNLVEARLLLLKQKLIGDRNPADVLEILMKELQPEPPRPQNVKLPRDVEELFALMNKAYETGKPCPIHGVVHEKPSPQDTARSEETPTGSATS